MIDQFIPQGYCKKCLGCCRFRESSSVWLPCLMDEEIQQLLDEKIPPALISADRKIQPIADPSGDGYICAFFDKEANKCKIYPIRPFECQLYPFLINLRGKKIILTLDLNCPYVKENLDTGEFREYIDRLASFLNSPAQIRRLKENPQLLNTYEDISNALEIKTLDDNA